MGRTSVQLRTRKEDLFAALRALEQDHEDGLVPDETYRAARTRFEYEAARVLEQLDRQQPVATEKPVLPRSDPRGNAWRIAAVISGLCLLASVVLLLSAATHHRLAFESVTGSVPQPAATAPPAPRQLVSAERAFRVAPRNYRVIIRLGNAYVAAGDLPLAERSYALAERLATDNPEAPTLVAMVLGAEQRYTPALSSLRTIEGKHRGYARAWLLDGLLSVHTPHGYRRAVRAWQRFLALDPGNTIAPRVRTWLTAARRAAHE